MIRLRCWFCLLLLFVLRGNAVELFDVGNMEVVKSVTLELSSDKLRPDDATIDVDKPLYTKKSENPQFGYDVAVMTFPLQGISTVALSAPGGASIEFADPGFVEWQNLNQLPTKSSHTEKSIQVMVIDPVEAYNAHAMFGSSLTVVNSLLDGQVADQQPELFIGGPEGVNCDKRTPTGDDSLSFDSIGYVYSTTVTYSSRSDILKKPEVEQFSKFEDVCYKGQEYKSPDGDKKTIQGGMAQANRNLLGFSGHLSRDGRTLMFGAPAFRTQAGYVYLSYRDDREAAKFDPFYQTPDVKLYYLCDWEKLKNYKGFSKKSGNGKSAFLDSIICDVDLTYGYSLGSVTVKIDGKDKTYLATGGPRAKGLQGEIKLFHFIPNQEFVEDSFEFLDSLVGTNFNSGFGTTILGADLDGDGSDELLVGEPYYTDDTTDTFNSGCVTVFAYNQLQKKYEQKYMFKSPNPSASSMFGFKLVSLGDLDADGGEDILVSALNATDDKKNFGKVHLFSGRSISLIYSSSVYKSQYPDILQTFQQSPSKLFGFSIAGSKTDLDYNGLPDLVIGDPGKDVQQAYVYYSSAFIRLLSPDGIPARLIYDRPEVDPDCPKEITSRTDKVINFCQKLNVKLENKGYWWSDPVNPNNPPVLKEWQFKNDFNVDVMLKKVADGSDIDVYQAEKAMEFGPDKENTGMLTFYVFGATDIIYGVTLKLVAETQLVTGNKIELEGEYVNRDHETSDFWKAQPVLAPELIKPIDISISPKADVYMQLEPSNLDVILGSTKNDLNVNIFIKTKSGREENFVNGELRINLGTKDLSLINTQSKPESLASCRKDTDNPLFIICLFQKDKVFSTAALSVNLNAKKLVDGEVVDNKLSLGYQLTWANSEKPGAMVEASNNIHIRYNGQLQATAKDAIVREGTAFVKNKTIASYALSLQNVGDSKIGKVQVVAYVPNDEENFSPIIEGLSCNSDSEVVTSKGRCSTPNCMVKSCTIPGEEDLKGEAKLIVKLYFKNADYWSKIVTRGGSDDLWFTADWEVLSDANYGTQGIKLSPSITKGTVRLATELSSDQQAFPWWIVIVSLIVSIAIVSILIIILYKKGFFTKKDPNKIRQDEIEDDEYADEDQGMTLKKTNETELNSGSAA